MNKYVLMALLLAPLCAKASPFHNAAGMGLQYGGVLGWQGSLTQNNWHERVGAGILGTSIGVDYSLDPKVSIGATFTAGALYQAKTINLNYYFAESYTSGWRAGLDAGVGHMEVLNKKDPDAGFVSVSVGYSF